MHGDFTRDTFDPAYRFTRVLLQQGRVQLDADSNEQIAIFWHYLRALARDLIGPYGGPGEASFEVEFPAGSDWFTIAGGVYYVDGIRCENPRDGGEGGLPYKDQPDYWRRDDDETPPDGPYLIFLDVWERFLTHAETEHPIREVALNGPDTAGRARAVWQVRVFQAGRVPEGIIDLNNPRNVHRNWAAFVGALLQRRNPAQLRARARRSEDDVEPCIIAPESQYRGLENQLYRVEIYRGEADRDASETGPTFTWDADNGSHTYPIRTLNGTQAVLDDLGRDDRGRLREGDLVEVLDSSLVLGGQRGPLYWVDAVDPLDQSVVLRAHEDTDDGNTPTYGEDDAMSVYPLLRRWTGYGRVADGLASNREWYTLQDGVQVQFDAAGDENQPDRAAPRYRPSDYWLIPARVATGDVEWPGPVDNPEWRDPHGIVHHYAPLAYVVDGSVEQDLRLIFKPLTGLP